LSKVLHTLLRRRRRQSDFFGLVILRHVHALTVIRWAAPVKIVIHVDHEKRPKRNSSRFGHNNYLEPNCVGGVSHAPPVNSSASANLVTAPLALRQPALDGPLAVR
jgi:hypothetical protein